MQKFDTLIDLLKKLGRPFGRFRFFDSKVLYVNFFRDYIKYKSKSLPGGVRKSFSCLHVAEHIGLGRYSEPIDPNETMKACKEFSRVLAQGGDLYFSMPVGKQKTYFNAHRVHASLIIFEYIKEFKLAELPRGNFNVGVSEFRDSSYATDFFHFRKL